MTLRGMNVLKIMVVTKTENWGRPSETRAGGAVDWKDISALLPQRSRQIDGEYQQVTTVVLKNGKEFEALGTPDEIEIAVQMCSKSEEREPRSIWFGPDRISPDDR